MWHGIDGCAGNLGFSGDNADGGGDGNRGFIGDDADGGGDVKGEFSGNDVDGDVGGGVGGDEDPSGTVAKSTTRVTAGTTRVTAATAKITAVTAVAATDDSAGTTPSGGDGNQ
jgi:hypothetical protein